MGTSLLSGLIHAGAAGAAGYQEGEDQNAARQLAAQKMLLARIREQEEQRLRDAQINNLQSEADARAHPKKSTEEEYSSEFDALVKGGMKPEDADRQLRMKYGKAPIEPKGPVVGSPEWWKVQDGLGRIRAKYRTPGGNNDRRAIDLGRVVGADNQAIVSNRSALSNVNKDMDRFKDTETVHRPKDPKQLPQFLSDSTEFAGLKGKKVKLGQRDSVLSATRDRDLSSYRSVIGGAEPTLGLAPEDGGDDDGSSSPPTKTVAGGATASSATVNPAMETEIRAAKDDLAAVFNSSDMSDADKKLAQNAYYARRAKIKAKYGIK